MNEPSARALAAAPLPSRRTCLKGLALLGALPALSLPARGIAANAQDVSATLEPLRTKFGLPALAAAVVRAGAVVAAAATGVRVRGTDIRVSVNDRFHLGSDTKAMTATLAGMAIEEGKLQWTSTIGQVLGADVPGMNPQLAAVTLEQLLSHSGGIPTDNDEILKLYFNTDAFFHNLTDLRLQMVNAWKSHAPQSPPGSRFAYANLGYVIVGAMLEKVTHTPWEELITRRLFEPLQLATAGLGAQATIGKLDAPVGHLVGDDHSITPMLWGAAADIPPALGPAGTVHMSALDFATWAGWNSGGGRRAPHLVKPETLARIHRAHVNTGKIPHPRPGTPQEGEYALGWGVVQFSWAKTPVLTHNGSNGMNLAKILVDTSADVGVVALTNYPGPAAEDATNAVTEALYRRYGPEGVAHT